MRFGIAFLLVLAGLVMLTLAVLPVPSVAGAKLLPYTDPEAIAAGAEIYKADCAACHGAQLQGQPDWQRRDAQGYLPAPPHDLSGHTWHHPDHQLIEIVKLGTEALVGGGYKSHMPGFANVLSDTEIAQVLAYIKSTWPLQIIKRHNEINANAAVSN